MISFTDVYGNLKPNSWDETSENPSVFNAVYFFTYYPPHSMAQLFRNKYETNNGTWRTMEFDPNPDWSIDEKISTLAFFYYNGMTDDLKKVPLFPAHDNSSFFSWFRPDVLAFHLYVRFEWKVCLYITLLKSALSIREFLKNPTRESSGAQLAFIKLRALNQPIFEYMSREGWRRVFDIYYPEREHPVRFYWQNH